MNKFNTFSPIYSEVSQVTFTKWHPYPERMAACDESLFHAKTKIIGENSTLPSNAKYTQNNDVGIGH